MIKNRIFKTVFSADKNLLQAKETSFALRSCNECEAVLFSISGTMLRLVTSELGNAPDTIVCEDVAFLKNKPEQAEAWCLSDGVLSVPYLTRIELKKADLFDSLFIKNLDDFPGHMKTVINRRARQNDFKTLEPIDKKLHRLRDALLATLTESVEIPLVEILGSGQGKLAAGDAALCGMLLTARVFATGKRFRVKWFNRLSVEIRRLMHRCNVYGKNWFKYALDGRMTEQQQEFFSVMARDFESTDEMKVNEIAKDECYNGKAFLAGVNTALEMIQKSCFSI